MSVAFTKVVDLLSTSLTGVNTTVTGAETPAHVTSVPLTASTVSSETPKTYFDMIFESMKLFGLAIGEQSEDLEDSSLRWDRLGSLAAYAFSAYGVSTFFVALILNRTTIIASSARARARSAQGNRSFSFFRKVPVSQGVILAILRLSSVVLLLAQASRVLVTLNVIGQSNNPSTVSRLTRWIPSNYFQYDVVSYAQDKYMQMPRDDVRFGPTTAMLWPVFVSVSYSLFIETFSAAISNEKPFLEGGLTLFELSLAIQEMSSGFFFLRRHSLAKKPTEQVLLVCLFSLADQACNQIGAIIYKNKYRLIPSTILSSLFVWYFCALFNDGNVFSLPSEIVFTYSALVLTLAVTAACALILLLTLATKGSRVDELNFANFFAEDHPNHEIFTQYLGLNLTQDFYTAAINLGMVAVTQAGKSSYFMAYSYVPRPRDTWVERNLWQSLCVKIEGAEKSATLSKDEWYNKMITTLSETQVSGYDLFIKNPPKRLINSSDAETYAVHRVGSMQLRMKYLIETLRRFIQLLSWAFISVFYYWPRNKYFKRPLRNIADVESDDHFRARKAEAPSFMRHLLVKNDKNAAKSSTPALQEHSGLDLAFEDDDSPDFEFHDDMEDSSDWDTEDESENVLNLTRPMESETSENTGSSIIAELITADNLLELIEDKEIVQHHLQYDYADSGIMTRSRYRALRLGNKTEDQTADLLHLIITKRRTQLKKDEKPSMTDDNLDDDLDPSIACVICQIEPRTLITWPCKCFAICEGCRVSLVAKNMKGCVCCRQDVEGVSRIYLP